MRLIRSNSGFRLLWSSRSVSFFGNSLSLVALLLVVAQDTGQGWAVAALLLVGDFVPALLGPVTGTVGDRFDLRRVLVTCDIACCVLVAVIALTLPPLLVLLCLVAVRSLAGQVFAAASRALVPALVAADDLDTANAALGFGSHGMEALGPLAAAGLLPIVHLRGVLFADAASFAVSAVLLTRLPAGPSGVAAAAEGASLWTDARAGLRYISTNKRLRAVILGFLAVVACTGVDDVALVFLVRDSLGVGQVDTALLYGAVGIGLLLGYALLARCAPRFPTSVLLLVGFAVSSAGNLLTGLAWAVPVAFLFQASRGVGVSAMDVASSTFLQRQVPPHLLARTFGNLYAGIGVAAGLSYLFGALLLQLTSPRTTFVTAGTGGLLVTAVTTFALSRASGAGRDGQLDGQ